MTPLTPRHHQILQLAGRGMTAKQTGVALGISSETVRVIRAQAIRRMGARNITEAAVKYEREVNGEVDAEQTTP